MSERSMKLGTNRVMILFNYRSPFCALIVDRMLDLGDRFEVEVVWKIAADVPRPSSLPVTLDNPRFGYNRQDCQRRAEWAGLPWDPPIEWRLKGVQDASRLGQYLLSSGSDAFRPFTIACNRAYWSHGRNISDANVVRQIALETGVTEAELTAAADQTREIDAQLASVMDWCEQDGILGVPYFTFRGEAFWGSDRLDDLERRLREAGLERNADPAGFALRERPVVPVAGQEEGYPVGRIFCVGRNYAEHAREMGFDAERDPPFFFMKYPEGLVLDGAEIPYPTMTSNFHYEMELVIAIGATVRNVDVSDAPGAVFGYAAGLDMTRRDLQLAARDKGRPWETGKAFDHSAVIGAIRPSDPVDGPIPGRIALWVNDEIKQDSSVDQLIWSVPEIVSNLSQFYTLRPGDLIFTGTPAGVGPVVPGDQLLGRIDGVGAVRARIGPPE